MACLKTIRINAETGEVEYLYPLEITPENRASLRDLVKVRHLETGMVVVGGRKINAVLIPVTEAQYHDLLNADKKAQNQELMATRCVINDGHGGTKLCRPWDHNPAYVEGGTEPRMVENRCDDCPRFQSYDCVVGREVLFSALTSIDEDGEDVDFDPVIPAGHYSGAWYEEIRQQFLDYVKAEKPRCLPLAEKLTLEFSQKDAADKLHKPATTVNSQTKILQDLVVKFLENIDSLY